MLLICCIVWPRPKIFFSGLPADNNNNNNIVIPLFITFGNKNYGNITIKFKTLHIIYTYQIKLSLAPLGINDCLCLTVRDTGILRCAGIVLQDLRLWP